MKKIVAFAVLMSLLVISLTAYAMGVRCPRCGLENCMWTGRTQTDAWGIHKEYECLNGHVFYID